MKICASISSAEELKNAADADFVRADFDLFDEIASTGIPAIVKARNEEEVKYLSSKRWKGYIDVGESQRPVTDMPVAASVKDDIRSSSGAGMARRLDGLGCDLAIGAFMVNRPMDLLSIYDAARNMQTKHVLIGLGEMGSITRYRQALLGNEFDLVHAGTPYYEGQMSIAESKETGTDSMLLGLIGHPLTMTASKKMYTQALRDAGINGHYINFDTVSLDGMDDVIKQYGIRGMNVTIPYRNEILAYLDVIDQSAKNTDAANMILNDGNRLIGSNTDVDGLKFALARANVEIEPGMKILVIGSGGVAKACCYHFTSKGAEVTIVGRSQRTVQDLCRRFGCSVSNLVDVPSFDMIVNCTPIGMYQEENYPIDITKIRSGQIILDVVYTKETKLEAVGRERGCTTVYGLDMLIGQGLRSFEIWTGKKADYDSIRRSLVGDSGRNNIQ